MLDDRVATSRFPTHSSVALRTQLSNDGLDLFNIILAFQLLSNHSKLFGIDPCQQRLSVLSRKTSFLSSCLDSSLCLLDHLLVGGPGFLALLIGSLFSL